MQILDQQVGMIQNADDSYDVCFGTEARDWRLTRELPGNLYASFAAAVA